MNSIKIRVYTKTETGYKVILGNGSVSYFTKITETRKFIADTNRFLTDQLFYLNELYTKTYNLYRVIWMIEDKYGNILTIEEKLDSANRCLTKAYRRSNFKDGNELVFINMIKAIRFLKEVLENERIIFKKRSDTYNIYRIDTIEENINRVNLQLKNYALVPDQVDNEEIPVLGKEINIITQYEAMLR